MGRWRWALLIFELFLFVLILILPQVDLPDFAFHRETAPITAKAKLTSPPVLVMAAAPVESQPTPSRSDPQNEPVASVLVRGPLSALVVLCTLRC
jgi:hypothetical protein